MPRAFLSISDMTSAERFDAAKKALAAVDPHATCDLGAGTLEVDSHLPDFDLAAALNAAGLKAQRMEAPR